MSLKDKIILSLALKPVPQEGGFYSESYRSKNSANASMLGMNADGPRTLGTAIYYMVTPGDFSALHRLKADEIFHFYAGEPADMVQIAADGSLRTIRLGSDLLAGEHVQVLVPAGTWQGLRLVDGGEFALLGTTMAPGFDFADFELGSRTQLTEEFPQLKDLIVQYTRE